MSEPTLQVLIEATAMLLGENTIICSCCLGKGASRGLFGGKRRCGQCRGTGFDYIGERTKQALSEQGVKW